MSLFRMRQIVAQRAKLIYLITKQNRRLRFSILNTRWKKETFTVGLTANQLHRNQNKKKNNLQNRIQIAKPTWIKLLIIQFKKVRKARIKILRKTMQLKRKLALKWKSWQREITHWSKAGCSTQKWSAQSPPLCLKCAPTKKSWSSGSSTRPTLRTPTCPPAPESL